MNFYRDVTIVVNGIDYKLHKVFLANSVFFDNLFQSNPELDVFDLYFPISNEIFKIIVKILYSNNDYLDILDKLDNTDLFRLYNACYYFEIKQEFITKKPKKKTNQYTKLLKVIKKNCTLVKEKEVFNPCVFVLNKRFRELYLKKPKHTKWIDEFNELYKLTISINPEMYSDKIKIYNIICCYLVFNTNTTQDNITAVANLIFNSRLNYFEEDIPIKSCYRNFLIDIENQVNNFKDLF